MVPVRTRVRKTKFSIEHRNNCGIEVHHSYETSTTSREFELFPIFSTSNDICATIDMTTVVTNGLIVVVVLGITLQTLGDPFFSFMIGGLKPIKSRITLDFLSLIFFSISTLLSKSKAKSVLLTLTLVLSVITAGSLTNRWTLTFPIAIAWAFQTLLGLHLFQGNIAKRFLGGVTFLCLIASAALCILFPATEIPSATGKYNVGIVTLQLPVNLADVYTMENATCSDVTDGFVSVRLLYPTKEEPDRIPYVKPDIAVEFLKMSMMFGAPPPLNTFGWMLHSWRLAKITAKPHAQPLHVNGGLPLIVYSHGLGGASTVYTYQSMMLASNGNLVLQIDHSDGSAPVVEQKDGTLLSFDFDPKTILLTGDGTKYVKRRREQTNHRAVEMLASTFALQKLNDRNIIELNGVSFVNRLKTTEVHFMGHSFGGATALTAAFRRPHLVSSIISHEPASDWMPDDARRALFPTNALVDCPHVYDGGTGGLAPDVKQTPATIKDFHVLILFSSEWYEKNWGRSDVIHWMHTHGKLCQQCTTEVNVIWNAHHNEFSDSCLMTPIWLARQVGLTGKRNPLETAEEISNRTLNFLEQRRLTGTK